MRSFLRYGFICCSIRNSEEWIRKCLILGSPLRKADDFSEWYVEVIMKAGFADYAPVKGCMIIREDAYAVWEKIQETFNQKIKSTGHRNVYFPCLSLKVSSKKRRRTSRVSHLKSPGSARAATPNSRKK